MRVSAETNGSPPSRLVAVSRSRTRTHGAFLLTSKRSRCGLTLTRASLSALDEVCASTHHCVAARFVYDDERGWRPPFVSMPRRILMLQYIPACRNARKSKISSSSAASGSTAEPRSHAGSVGAPSSCGCSETFFVSSTNCQRARMHACQADHELMRYVCKIGRNAARIAAGAEKTLVHCETRGVLREFHEGRTLICPRHSVKSESLDSLCFFTTDSPHLAGSHSLRTNTRTATRYRGFQRNINSLTRVRQLKSQSD